MLLENNSSRRSSYSEFKRADIWVKKRFIVSEMLFQRNALDQIYQLYDRIIEKCIQFEIYDTLVETLLRKRNLVSVREGKLALNEVSRQIEYYQKCKIVFDTAEHYFFQLSASVNFSSEPEQNEFVHSAIKELAEAYDKYNSKNIYFYLSLLKLYKLEIQNDLDGAIELLGGLRQVILSSPAINRPQKRELVEINIANLYLRLNNAEGCNYHASLLITISSEDTFNISLAKEHLFMSEFHLGNFGKAHLIIKNLLVNTSPRDTFYKAKRYYYHACVLFLQRRHKYAHDCLQFTKALDADKNGWNIAVRILDIMNQIQWGGLYHSADAHIDNLRDHIFKTRKIKPITPRNLAILDILKALVKEGFNFDTVAAQKASVLQKLSSGNEDYEWNMISPELIRFDAWFMAKVKKVEYRYDLVVS